MTKIMQGIGTILIIFLTPFLPDGISRFSPIIIGLLGGGLIKADWK